MNKQDRIKVVVGICSFMVLIYLYVNEFDFIVNTINFQKLVIYALIIGALLVAILLIKFTKDLKLFEKFMLVMASVVLLLILMPLFGSLSNRLLGDRHPQIRAYKLISIEARSEQPYGLLDSTLIQVDGHHALIQLEHDTTSFYLKNGVKYSHTEDSIFLPIKRGFWGFTYVDLSQR